MRHGTVLERVYVRLYAVQGDLMRLGTLCVLHAGYVSANQDTGSARDCEYTDICFG